VEPPTPRKDILSLIMSELPASGRPRDHARVDTPPFVVSAIDRRSFQQRPCSRRSMKLYRVPACGCVSTGLPLSFWSNQIAFRCPFRPVRWFHITTCDERSGSFERSKAHGASIGCVVRDLVSRLHRGTLRVSRKKGRSFVRVPSLGRGRSLPLLNIRTGIHSSTVK